MSRWNLAWLMGLPAVVVLGLALSYSAPLREKDQDYQMVRTVVEVLGEVDQHFVRELTPEQRRKLVEDMINGGLERLDPYSVYFNEAEYKHFNSQSEGNFGGIGIQLGYDRLSPPNLMVISPMVGTPAHEAGVLAGDLILKVDDKPTESMRMSEAIRLIQGEPGTPITLTVLHEGSREPEAITIVRGKIEVHSVLGDARKKDDPKQWDYFVDKERRIAYIRVVGFNEHTVEDLRKAIEQVRNEGVNGLVLDLRDNPGGLLSSAVELSDLFLMEGQIVQTRDRRGHGKTYTAKGEGTLLEPAKSYPMAVLINKNSASASEIVAAALQDHKRAVVVGERSYGKGSVQKVIRLGGEPPTALKLTTDTYWRPSGHNIHRHEGAKDEEEWGVKPDEGYTVKLSDEQRREYLVHRRTRDVIHGNGKNGAPPPKPKGEEKKYVDPVLEKALEHLRKEIKPGAKAAAVDLTVPGNA